LHAFYANKLYFVYNFARKEREKERARRKEEEKKVDNIHQHIVTLHDNGVLHQSDIDIQ